jgi:surface polysaccharide O-acyltransferase-like enzyme
MTITSHEPSGVRMYFLDNIRSTVIVFVVVFHALLPYVPNCPWWYVVDPPAVPWGLYAIILLEPILMPVLFFISGLLVWPSYARKGPPRFLIDKLRRLMAPFLLCTLFFSPIMPFIRHWGRAAENGAEPLGFWPFWLTYLESGSEIHAGAAASNPDLVVNQYWFLLLLFLFFCGFALYNAMRGRLRPAPRTERRTHAPSRLLVLASLAAFVGVVGLTYTLICNVIEGTVWVTLGSLVQVQPAKVPIYLGFFLAGIVMERRDWLPTLLGIGRPILWFAVAVASTAAYLAAVIATLPPAEPSAVLVVTSRLLRVPFVVSATLWALTFFHQRLNGSTLPWQELAENSYNIYLIHMVPQVVLQLLALSWPIPNVLKFAVVSLFTLLLSYLLSRFVVRRSTIGTVLGLAVLFTALVLWFR